jgi:hypothetical protein
VVFLAFIGDLEEGRGEGQGRVMRRFFIPTCRPGRTLQDDLSSIRAHLLLSAGSVAATVLAIQVRDGVHETHVVTIGDRPAGLAHGQPSLHVPQLMRI